ncbi:MAG: class I SAM-dependent methyltransferase [Bacteroidota bacterium]
MKYKFLTLSMLLALSIGCNPSQQKQEQDQEHSKGKEHAHGGHQHHGGANEYMHQASVDELVKRFESEERNAYQKPDEVLKFLGDLSGKKIIDIGAGSGYFSVRLAELGAKVIAADVDDEFQAYIKKRIEDNGLEELGIELRKIPYDSPSLEKGEVDMVLIVNTYHHIEDRLPYFKQVLEGIAEGGELVIIDFFKRDTPVGPPLNHKIAKDVVVKELKEAGFTEIEENTELLEYQYILRAK